MASRISILINKKNNRRAYIIKEDGQNNRRSSMENTTIQQIHTTPTNNKDLRIYKEERNQELSNTAQHPKL